MQPWTRVLAAALLPLAACSSVDRPDVATGAIQAEIRRTAYGVPHIKAADEAGLGYGVGYAFAQDNYCLLVEEIVSVNGERSRYFGADGADVYRLNNLRADFYFKLVNDDAQAAALWDKQSPEVQALIRGYVAGVNRYLRDTGAAALPAACRDAAWVRPITTLDAMKLVRRMAGALSSEDFIDAFYAAAPPTTQQGTAAPDDRAIAAAALGAADGPLSVAERRRKRERLGSNALALGAEATANGRGILFGNPHFYWFGALRLYQMHLTIPGRLDVMGASLSALPVVNIGFTENFAWSHTVNTSLHYTLFALTLDPADPTRYLLDGKSVPMTRRTLAVAVRGADGSVTTQTRTVYGSVHGPIVVVPDKLPWTAQRAFALRDANLESWRFVETFYRMNRARDLAEFAGAIEGTVGLPWVNTIAADRHGDTYYADVTVVPNVPAAQERECVPAAYQPLLAGGGHMVLAGDRSACMWTIDPAAPQPGIFAARDLPKLWRRDFVHNANDSAWLTNPAAPIVGYPSAVSRDGSQQEGRTRLGLTQVQARLAGRDGRSGNRFDLPTLQEIAFSNRVYFAELFLDDALAAACTPPSTQTVGNQAVDLTQACAVLAGWDRRAELTSVGLPLFEGLWAGIANAPALAAVPFAATDPLHTPRGLKRDDATTTAVRTAMARAVLRLRAGGVALDAPWGEVQVAVKRERIPMHGGSGMLGIYNAMGGPPAKDGRRVVTYGASYVQFVTWDDAGPAAETLLAFSQSTDPASPYYEDQTRLFSRKQWVRQPFREEEIRRDPTLTVTRIAE